MSGTSSGGHGGVKAYPTDGLERLLRREPAERSTGRIDVDRAGPTDEPSRMAGARWVIGSPKAAVGSAVLAMYALIAAPSTWPTWTVGTKWKSRVKVPCVGLYMIMPTPPALRDR